jgi:hypothetical protein
VLLGALCFAGASGAQVAPVPPPGGPPGSDSSKVFRTPEDSIRADSAKAGKDTLVAPYSVAPVPTVLEIGDTYTWDRAALFNTGLITIYDVLERVPGLTMFRSGWVTSPQYAAYLGNPGRVRIFWDGVETIALGASTSYPVDLETIPIWAVQQMTLERGADEVRIYLQSWTVQRTVTQSRIDIVTGDLGTNMLRGYFGTRFLNGIGVKFGGQVYGTTSDITIGGGTGSDLMMRVGWARGRFSVDAYAERANGTRDPQIATTDIPLFAHPELAGGIPGQNGHRTNAYLRLGLGQADSSRWWVQAMLDEQDVVQQLAGSLTANYFPVDSDQVKQSATQVIAAAGLNAGPLSVSGSGRYRWLPGGTSEEITGRAAFTTRIATFSGYVDYIADSGGITDLALKVTPTSWLALEGGVGYRIATAAQGGDGVSGRVAVGARLGRVWISVGALERAPTVVPGLTLYDTLYKSASARSATGPFLSIKGKVVQDVGISVWAVRWDNPGYYRPQTQARGEVYLDTDWKSRFPSGHFGLHAAFGAAIRSDVIFPTTLTGEVISPAAITAYESKFLFTNLEIRVLDATVYFTANWALDPRPYELVPQYPQEIQVFTYGLRWSFWN